MISQERASPPAPSPAAAEPLTASPEQDTATGQRRNEDARPSTRSTYIDEAIEETMIASDPPALTPETGIGPRREPPPGSEPAATGVETRIGVIEFAVRSVATPAWACDGAESPPAVAGVAVDSRDPLPDRSGICQNGPAIPCSPARRSGSRSASTAGVVHVATTLGSFTMNRREFLQAGAATAGLALSAAGYHVAGSTAAETKRVGLIGSGWYGKADLLRLIQVAPVEVVSLCDVDKKMLAEAAEIVATRQASKKTPAHLRRLPRDAQGEGPRHRPDRHARPLARPADDRRRRGRGRRLRPEADQRRRGRGPGDARRRPQAQAGRAGRHPAPEHAAPDRGPRPDHPRGEARQDRPGRNLLLLPHAATTATRPTPIRPTTSTRRCGPARPRCGRTTRSSIPGAGGRSWSTATASWATCASTCSTWSAGCSAWAGRSGSARRAASWSTRAARRTSPTRRRPRSTSATWTSSGSTAPGASRPTRSTPGARPSTATRGRSRPSVIGYDFTPMGGGKPIHGDVDVRAGAVPRGQDREGPGAARRPGDPRPHEGLPGGDRLARPAGGRHRGGLHLDGELHPGQPGAASSAGRSPGTRRPARSSATTRPTGSWPGRTAARGSTRGKGADTDAANGRRSGARRHAPLLHRRGWRKLAS